ncbi:hypothetical protein DH2020_042945 [Rehmannia glutinosa]|uniref:Dof-type domain-containing protein n=1 Tax=Rehmannia glutinosa TaxID=99300 RepID=A0ABR0UMW8_REHGL
MTKEPELKLFGRKIFLPENGGVVAGGEYSGEYSGEGSNGSGGSVDYDRCLDVSIGKQADEDQEERGLCETTEQNEDQTTNPSSESDDNPKTDDVLSENHLNTENERTDSTNDQAKTLKKPDKIVPCPRCNSMDTKFCYYNNYNVNQPRHFCKSCQRYWTNGGTMRNVPVGAGRRKNKNSASHCRHITISEALHENGLIRHMKFNPNGTVLSFGPDSPLCESMASGLNLAEKRASNGVTTSNLSTVGGKNALQNMNGFQIPQVYPWPYTWNSSIPVPAIYPPGYPMPYYYTAPVWHYSVPNSPNANQNAMCPGPSPSSPLGKHSRNGELLRTNILEVRESENSECSIVVPKTLRIDDPDEAAKSSIWSTLGIKYDSIRREGLLKALQPKGYEKKSMVTNSPLLQANPAALSRSMSFRERA